MGTMTLKLTVTVKYQTNGETQETLQDVLRGLVDYGANLGLMSNETAADVDDWFVNVERIA